MLNILDFPAPFGPKRPKTSPALIPNVFPATDFVVELEYVFSILSASRLKV